MNQWQLREIIQIKIELSVDLVRILIKILVESHMAFNWEIKSTFDSTLTDRPALKLKVALPLFKHYMGMLAKHQAIYT